jgi:hypothetical protein
LADITQRSSLIAGCTRVSSDGSVSATRYLPYAWEFT